METMPEIPVGALPDKTADVESEAGQIFEEINDLSSVFLRDAAEKLEQQMRSTGLFQKLIDSRTEIRTDEEALTPEAKILFAYLKMTKDQAALDAAQGVPPIEGLVPKNIPPKKGAGEKPDAWYRYLMSGQAPSDEEYHGGYDLDSLVASYKQE